MAEPVRSTFTNPLTVDQPRPFDRIRFGQLPFSEGELAVRQRMMAEFGAVLDKQLPASQQATARQLLCGYANGSDDFFVIFYPFIWSFLYWIPACRDQPSLPLSLVRAHALSLFLHLWDDHLCDGQLATDIVTLQMRGAAWSQMVADFQQSSEELKLENFTAPVTSTYLKAMYEPCHSTELEGFLSHFTRQISTWQAAPRLASAACGRPGEGRDLAEVIACFSRCWRIVDDLADLSEDVRADQRSAVWMLLDEYGRQVWQLCYEQALAHGQPSATEFERLARHIVVTGVEQRLLARARQELTHAQELCRRREWAGLPHQLGQMIANLS